ncbi:MAG: ATP-binding protein [Candidatus Omnitrophota bacterium]
MKKSFRLKEKLILITAVTILLTVTLDSYLNIRDFSRTYKEAVVEKVFSRFQTLQRVIGDLMELGLGLDELEGIDRECQNMVYNTPFAKYCFVMDNRGKLIYHSYSGIPGLVYKDSIAQAGMKLEWRQLRFYTTASRERIYDFTLPIYKPSGEQAGLIKLGVLSEIVDVEIFRLARRAVITGFFFILLAIGMIFLLSRYVVLKPLSKLMQGIAGFGKGDLNTRVELGRDDEIGELASSFNRMAESTLNYIAELKESENELKNAYAKLKETQDQLIHAEKLHAIGQLASGVAHEVRNPLGIILQGINYLETRMPPDDSGVLEAVKMVKDNIKRADKIIDSLYDFSRASSIELKPQDINSILEVSLSLLKNELKFGGIELDRQMKKGLPSVMADKNKLEQVFINLLLNAIQAMPDGGRIIIRSYGEKALEPEAGAQAKEKGRRSFAGENAVIVEIEDTGIGIPAENLEKVFDPFFTTKGPREGAGLGLSVTKNIITMHGGRIELRSRQKEGTRVRVTLRTGGGDNNG